MSAEADRKAAGDLDVVVAGRDVRAGGVVEAVAEYGTPLILDIRIRNLTDYEIREIRVLSNLPENTWAVEGSAVVPPRGETTIVLTADAAALYNAPATLKRIAVDLEYRKVRRFG